MKIPKTAARGRFTVGDPVYPSHADAPDWRWEKDEHGKWHELSRPEPVLYTLHPNFDDTEKMEREKDYPPSMASAVRDFNYIHTAKVRNIISRSSSHIAPACSPQFLMEALDKSHRGSQAIRLYRATNGFTATKPVSIGDAGFVPNGWRPSLWQRLKSGLLTMLAAAGLISCSGVQTTNMVAIDGDTIRHGGEVIRLAGIDAPEMPGHCRRGRRCVDGDPYAAKDALQWLLHRGQGNAVCKGDKLDYYGRRLAVCWSAGVNINEAMLALGHAQKYRRTR